MVVMSETQAWTAMISMITLLAAALAFSLRLMSRTFIGEMHACFAAQDRRIDVHFARVDARFDQLDARLDALIG